MSNHRKPRPNGYHHGYLRSPAWFARRDRWFTSHRLDGGVLACEGCGGAGTVRTLELHHVDYTAVTLRHGRWVAGEPDEDLIPLHPGCHELLHRLIDRDRILSRHRTRRDATGIALTALRPKLRPLAQGGTR